MSGARGEQLRFVVVTGDELSRVTIKRHLTASGSRVIGESEDMKSGLRLVRGLAPDVCILQIGEDATATFEAVRKLRDELPALGIILLSGDGSPQLILGGIRAGAQEFLTTPLDLTELDRAVERVRILASGVPV